MEAPGKLLYLYPEKEVFDHQIRSGSNILYDTWVQERGRPLFKSRIAAAKNEKEKRAIQEEARADQAEYFEPFYYAVLNDCIKKRYRDNGFDICFLLMDNEPLASSIRIGATDKIIYSGMTNATQCTKDSQGNFQYPNPDHILDQVLPTPHLRIAGFHLWDCVQRIGKRAYERGVDVLVDEDLTDSLNFVLRFHPEFNRAEYPSHNPFMGHEDEPRFAEMFFEARAGKPWMHNWQTVFM